MRSENEDDGVRQPRQLKLRGDPHAVISLAALAVISLAASAAVVAVVGLWMDT